MKKETKTNYKFGRISVFTKSISITPENLDWIKNIKVKKSAAGKLNEIIEYYKNKHYGNLPK